MDKEINSKALNELEKLNFAEAQKLFFKNARKYPSYQTYNNLGYYLISEGLLCKNGETKNAITLGVKYLLKSSEMCFSETNVRAIVRAIDFKLRKATRNERNLLYTYAREILRKALSIQYSDELQYNYLSFCCLSEPQNESILQDARKLVKRYKNTESVELYFELLRINSLKDEGLWCIANYGNYLDEVDLLMFYTKFEMYEKAYELCESVYNRFVTDKFISSAIIESCVHTKHFEEAKSFALQISDSEKDSEANNKWYKSTFDNLHTASAYRKKQIEAYKFFPSIIHRCGYFGCERHRTAW